jgi:hypothetical protein
MTSPGIIETKSGAPPLMMPMSRSLLSDQKSAWNCELDIRNEYYEQEAQKLEEAQAEEIASCSGLGAGTRKDPMESRP